VAPEELAPIPSQELRVAGTFHRDKMILRTHAFVLLLALAAGVNGCVHAGEHLDATAAATAPATLEGDAAHPGKTSGWVETRLYFGLGPADHPERGVSESEWRDFLDKEVTPRFPDGLSVADLYGQWLRRGSSTPERLRSKALIIDYPDTQNNREKIEAIRAAWKRLTGDQSVMRVTEPADVSF
jgi:Protein of unknown function (DUF3574)